MRRVVLPLLVLVAACRHEDTRPVLTRFPIRPHVRWDERIDREGKVQVLAREESWTSTAPNVWDVTTTDVQTGVAFYRARYALTDEGLAQIAVLDRDRVVPVEPPRLALPARPVVGYSWQRDHQVGAQRTHRACDVGAWTGCKGGIEVRCTTRYEGGRTVDVHNRYCDGVGIVGYESNTDGKILIKSENLADVAKDAG